MRRVWKRFTAVAAALVLVLGGAALFAYLQPLWVADHVIRYHLWRSGVRSDYVAVDGYRIHYFEAKPPNGEAGTPLLLIHGLGARGEDWSAMIPGLAAAGFHVYVPDLLGYGRSARPDVSYSISMEEKLIVDYLRAMHVEQADVAGWSMGGWIAMKLALDEAPMVRRLVLFDSAGVYFAGYTNVERVSDVKDGAGVNRLLQALTPHPPKIPGFVERDLLRRLQKNFWVVKRSLAAMTSGRDLLDFRLHALQQPTLVVWGAQDGLIPLSSGESIHRRIPGSSMLVVDGCGHLTPAECYKVSLQATVTFLRAEPAVRGAESSVIGKK